MNRSANRLSIGTTNLDGVSLANHGQFAKFAKLSPSQIFLLHGMAKHLRGKTFVFRVENGYLLENFHISRLIMPINKVIIRGKRFVKIRKKHESFPLKCFAVYGTYLHMYVRMHTCVCVCVCMCLLCVHLCMFVNKPIRCIAIIYIHNMNTELISHCQTR